MSPALERELFTADRLGRVDLLEVADALATFRAEQPPEAPPKGRKRAASKRAAAADEVVAKRWVVDDNQRWVPIGPSVVRRGQATGRPRVVGRVRDLAVSPDGMRAYAASGMGGVWYTGDAGHSWAPVGGWTPLDPFTGGNFNPRAVGCLLVAFDAGNDPAQDFVVVGTGEPPPFATHAGQGLFGGLGVLAGRGPATRPIDQDPWEARPAAQVRLFEGIGFWRLARRPGRTAGSTTAGSQDELLAATSGGLFRGVRTAAGPTYTWNRVTTVDALPGGVVAGQRVSDVVWHPGGRIVIAVHAVPPAPGGVAFSTDNGATWTWLNGCSPLPAPGSGIRGRTSLAAVPGTNRIYALTTLPPPAGPNQPPDTPGLFRIADITVAAPAAVNVAGVPATLWGRQAFYDQAIAVDLVGALDRVYLGGSFNRPPAGDLQGGVWCFDVGAGPALVPTPGISTTAAPVPPAPPVGAGADAAGLIGNNIHPDIHSIVLTGGAAPNRHVWVGCDGGVFVSTSSGRVHTFASRCNGLAAVQPTFFSQHPTSSHFLASGFQDAGMQVRSGDTVWEKVSLGDGGGTVFHPTRSHHIVGQAFGHFWRKVPDSLFDRPTRNSPAGDAEDAQALFYSGAAAIATGATTARICVGTHRVWMSANIGSGATATWQVLPFAAAPGAVTTDPRDNAGNNNQPAFGVPFVAVPGEVNANGVGPLRGIVTMRWVAAGHLLVLFQRGVVRYIENAGRWTATLVLGPATQPATAAAAGTTILTDIVPAPGGAGQDFYLTTTGDTANAAIDTCYHFTGGGFVATGLRNSLPVPPGSPPGTPPPREPAYSVAVDATAPARVYVGTVTGVWSRAHPAPPGTAWTRFDNGLPQAAAQDLAIWTDPADPASPRLMRAAVQARGIWEVDLAAPEPSRTYVRVHARDDRRRFPTPMANPRRAPGTTEENTFESPDIVVRPRASAGISPSWRLGVNGRITEGSTQTYQLWTFQTAFRWIYPSVIADGQWTDTFGDLVELHRATLGLPAAATTPPGQRFIDQALWNAVVGGTRVDPDTGLPSANAVHPLAVYRPAWHTPARTLTGELRRTVPATEVDLIETVQPRSVVGGVWQVHSEVSTVDVLLHHRDMRPVPENGAFAMLLHRAGANREALLNSSGADLAAFALALAAGNAHATPAGWTLADGGVAGASLHRLPTTLDARMPRAVSVDVDLSGVAKDRFVLFLAIVGSTPDLCTTAPVALPPTPTVRQVVRRWPYAALRLVQVAPRPGP